MIMKAVLGVLWPPGTVKGDDREEYAMPAARENGHLL